MLQKKIFVFRSMILLLTFRNNKKTKIVATMAPGIVQEKKVSHISTKVVITELVEVQMYCENSHPHPYPHSICTGTHIQQKEFNLYLSSVNGLSSNQPPFTFIEGIKHFSLQLFFSFAHSHFVFYSKPLFICTKLNMSRYTIQLTLPKLDVTMYMNKVCGLKAAYAWNAFITIDICSSLCNPLSVFLYIFCLLIRGYNVIVFHCMSIHLISIRQTFTAPDLILQSVCMHTLPHKSIAHCALCSMQCVYCMCDADKASVKCRA